MIARRQQVNDVMRLVSLGYLLFFLGIIFGITALVGAIINHTHINKTVGTFAHSHIKLQLVGFWSIVLLASAFYFAISTSVMWIVALAVWIATLVTGMLFLLKHQPVPLFKLQHLRLLNKQESQIE